MIFILIFLLEDRLPSNTELEELLDTSFTYSLTSLVVKPEEGYCGCSVLPTDIALTSP